MTEHHTDDSVSDREPAPVGRVLSTEPSTTGQFQVALAEGQYLQLDELVYTETVPEGTDVTVRIYGTVTECEARYDGTRFVADTFRVGGEPGALPAELGRTATVDVVRVEPEMWVPAEPAAPVRRAVGRRRAEALYEDQIGRSVPAGFGKDGQPVLADLDFFDGTKGGHMSISGMSGVATKTSYALFFLRMLTASADRQLANMRILVFNTKGEDLLWLDRPNRLLTPEAADEWGRLGIPAGPFPNVAFAAPAQPTRRILAAEAGGRASGIHPYGWTVRQFVDGNLFEYLFSDDDVTPQLGFLIERVTDQLRRDTADIEDRPGHAVIRGGGRRWDGQAVLPTFGEKVVSDLDGLRGRVEQLLDADHGEWARPYDSPQTVAAFIRRLRGAAARVGRLIRPDVRPPDRGDAQVTVVHIGTLHDMAQRFVVGALLREVFTSKETSGRRTPLSVVVLDELNKYAPRVGDSPLRQLMIDIAQRGRSLGVLLVGAQQTASTVAPELLQNAALRVVGRLDAAESSRPEYGWLPQTMRERARLLKPGDMFLSQPPVPTPIVVRFPFPPYATREEETGTVGPPDGGWLPDMD